MKNKLLLSILAAFGLAGASSQAQTTTFVDVATLGDGVSVITTGGTIKVDATVLTKNQRWTRDRVYILANNVIVPAGITLTIEPGTLIRAEQPWRASAANGTTEAASTPADPGALVVAREGRLIAAGTADAPIIFTSIDDPNVPGGVATIPPFENKGKSGGLNNERVLKTGYSTISGTAGVGQYTISGGTLNSAVAKNYGKTWATTASAFSHDGLWGGIVLAGKATVVRGYTTAGENANDAVIVTPTVNSETGAVTGTQKGLQAIEGMAGFSQYMFGGGDTVNPPDDSGILRFVSNRYGGYVIAQNAELNSYSFYGVGRGTVLEFLEAWNNADDDFEFWGGDVSFRYALSLFCGDDGFDTDQGYLGTAQYLVQIQNNANGAADSTTINSRLTANYGDSLTENDGPEANNTAFPLSTYILANGTMIGRGYASAGSWSTSSTADPYAGPNFRDNGGARWYNTLIMDNPGGAVLITDRTSSGDATTAQANSSLGRYNAARGSGGFDGAGRDIALTGASTGPSDGPDGLFHSCIFFRNGLADSAAAGVAGKYANKAAFDAAYNNGSPSAGWDTASDSEMFPASHGRSGRGASANGDVNRANTASVIAALKATGNYNQFNVDPGLNVNPYTRISGLDLRPSASAARTAANSAVPSVRGLNSDANFVGAVRDNMWMRGWTLADQLGVFAGSQIDPEVSVSANGSSQPVITFGGEAGVKYVVEVSTDNKTYTKVQTVSASAGNNTVTDTARTVGSTPLFYRVIAL